MAVADISPITAIESNSALRKIWHAATLVSELSESAALVRKIGGGYNGVVQRHWLKGMDFADIMVDAVTDEGMKTKVYCRWADLRHVACCNMLDVGLTVDQVANILGHTSTVMVGRVYGNRQKESTQQRQADIVAAGMERILGEQITAR